MNSFELNYFSKTEEERNELENRMHLFLENYDILTKNNVILNVRLLALEKIVTERKGVQVFPEHSGDILDIGKKSNRSSESFIQANSERIIFDIQDVCYIIEYDPITI